MQLGYREEIRKWKENDDYFFPIIIIRLSCVYTVVYRHSRVSTQLSRITDHGHEELVSKRAAYTFVYQGVTFHTFQNQAFFHICMPNSAEK